MTGSVQSPATSAALRGSSSRDSWTWMRQCTWTGARLSKEAMACDDAAQLAGHVAGIRHYGANYDGLGPPGAPHFDSVTAGLTLFQNDPLLFEPGTSYSYSSYGWNLISAVIEGAAKQEFLHYIQGAVLEPLRAAQHCGGSSFRLAPRSTEFFDRD